MLESEISTVTHSGNASTTTPYVVTFSFLNPEHLQVIVTDSSGTSTTLVAEVDYNLTGIYSSDGARYSGATLTTAIAYPATSIVTIQRVTPVLQPTELKRTGRFSAETLETAIDRQAMIAQEMRRDVSPADSQVKTLGAGVVVKNGARGFAVRSFTAAENSGLAVTNGDGVAGNPTIDTDFSTLPTVTTLADDDLVPVCCSGEEATIPVANLRPEVEVAFSEFYRSFFMLASDMGADEISPVIFDTVDYATASEEMMVFNLVFTTTINLRIILPDDYSGGTVKMRLLQRNSVIGSVATEKTVVWRVRTAKGTHNSGTLDNFGGYLTVTQGGYYGEDEYLQGSPIDLGSGWSANDPILFEISRDSDDAADTFSNNAQIFAVEFQYPAQPVTTAWS